MKSVISKIKWSVHVNTLVFVTLIVIGGTLPLSASFVISKIWNSWHGWEHLLYKGELFLFSAAFFTHAAYLLFEHKRRNYDFIAIIGWVCVILLALSSMIYGTLILPKELLDVSATLNLASISQWSIVCFCISVIALYLGIYKDNERNAGSDVVAEAREEVEDMMNKLS